MSNSNMLICLGEAALPTARTLEGLTVMETDSKTATDHLDNLLTVNDGMDLDALGRLIWYRKSAAPCNRLESKFGKNPDRCL